MTLIDEDRVESIFQELSRQLEGITLGELKRSAYQRLEDRAYSHELEERRAKEQLPIILDRSKQDEIYREINLKRNRSKENAAAYIKAKQGF